MNSFKSVAEKDVPLKSEQLYYITHYETVIILPENVRFSKIKIEELNKDQMENR